MIVAIMPCHNRANLAVEAAKALEAHSNGDVRLVVVDDQSTDGTAQKVCDAWTGKIDIIQTKREMFWARSLALGERVARKFSPSHIVWLNEDTLISSALSEMLHPTFIQVATILSADGIPIKGPLKQIAPCKFRLANTSETPDTFNGHLVAIPRCVFKHMEIEDYSHAFADIHYGLTAAKKGFSLSPCTATASTALQQRENWRDLPTFMERWIACMRPTGLPPRDWGKFCKAFGGHIALFRFAAGYRFLFWRRQNSQSGGRAGGGFLSPRAKRCI